MHTKDILSIDLETQLKSNLHKLEKLRKETVRTIIIAMTPFFLKAGLIAGFLSYKLGQIAIGEFKTSDDDYEILLAGLVGIGIILLVTGWFFWGKRSVLYQTYFYDGEYARAYNREVVEELIARSAEKVSYDPDQGIAEHDFRQSGFPLFSNPQQYRSTGSIRGQIGETTFTFAEVHATQLIKDSQSQHEGILFKGVFFVVDFHKQTHWNTIVYPDFFKYFSSLLIGRFSDEKEFSQKKYIRIKLEDREFEKYFQVYGTDQVESRYILSPALMSRIVDFRKKSKKKLQFSFKDSKICFAVHYPATKGTFRPPLFRSVYHLHPLKKYLMDIQLMLGIVRELNLNSQLTAR